jgi:hypothetical protein
MDPDQIRASIEETQDDLGRNVNALTDKVNPRRAAQQRVNRARGIWQKIRDNVMGSATHARDNVMGSATHARANVMGGATHARDATMHARDTTLHAADASQARLSGASSAAGERLHTVGQQTQQQTQGHPLAAGLVAFGLGILASSLLPASPPERRMAGQFRNKASEHSDQLKQQATGVARQAQDNLREPAQRAAESVKSKAGQDAAALREQTRSTGQNLRGQAQQTANDVRQR